MTKSAPEQMTSMLGQLVEEQANLRVLTVNYTELRIAIEKVQQDQDICSRKIDKLIRGLETEIEKVDETLNRERKPRMEDHLRAALDSQK